MNRPSPVQPVDFRPVVSTGVGIALVVVGAILRFAATARFAHVLNAHVARVIVMLVGVFALLLSLLVWGPLNRRRSHSGGHDREAPRPGSADQPRYRGILAGRSGADIDVKDLVVAEHRRVRVGPSTMVGERPGDV